MLRHMLPKGRTLLTGTAAVVVFGCLVGALYLSRDSFTPPAGPPGPLDQIIREASKTDFTRIAKWIFVFLALGTIMLAIVNSAPSVRMRLSVWSKARERRRLDERNRRIAETLRLIEEGLRSTVGVDD